MREGIHLPREELIRESLAPVAENALLLQEGLGERLSAPRMVHDDWQSDQDDCKLLFTHARLLSALTHRLQGDGFPEIWDDAKRRYDVESAALVVDHYSPFSRGELLWLRQVAGFVRMIRREDDCADLLGSEGPWHVLERYQAWYSAGRSQEDIWAADAARLVLLASGRISARLRMESGHRQG